MKLQIKSLLIPAFTAFVYTSVAQGVTVVAGGNYTNIAYDQGSGTGVEDTYKDKLGFHAGAYLDYVINKDRRQELVFETGLLFDSKGAKQEFQIGELNQQVVTNLFYIDVPFYLQYRYRFRNLNKIYAGIGPFVGFGLSGKATSTQTLNGESNEIQHKIKWGNDDENDVLKRYDYGVSARVGFYFDSGLDVSASYDYGIPNIASMGENIKMRSRVLRVSLGYTFSWAD